MSDRIKVQQASDADINAIMKVEAEAWTPAIQANKEQFLERLQVFPEGFFLAEFSGEVAGVLTSQILEYKFGEMPFGWENTTNHGWIATTHKVSGNALYIVSVGVSKKAQRKGVGSVLVQTAQNFAKKKKLEYIILDSRLPEYKTFFESGISPKDYVGKLNTDFEQADPELKFYHRLGFRVLSPCQIISSCMGKDEESASYGVRMVWITE